MRHDFFLRTNDFVQAIISIVALVLRVISLPQLTTTGSISSMLLQLCVLA
jgi:hypothetical protein